MGKKSNKQFQSLVKVFNDHEVPYWIDSGTLLGVMRDGKVLDHDKDIDICMWTRDEDKLASIIPFLKEMGYVTASDSYGGVSYKYMLYPKKRFMDKLLKKRTSLLQVQINLFNESETHAWCYAARILGKYYTLGSSSSSKKIASSFSDKALYLAKRCFLKLKHYTYRLFGNVEAKNFPWLYLYQPATWWIPKHYFQNTTFIEDKGVCIPSDWHSYLTLRYGDWQNPTESWYCWRDDKTLRHYAPEELLGTEKSTESSSDELSLLEG